MSTLRPLSPTNQALSQLLQMFYATSLVSVIAVSIVASSSCSNGAKAGSKTAEAFGQAYDPSQLNGDYNTTFEQLPVNGELKEQLWTDSYWPSNKAGIANRWNNPTSGDGSWYPLMTEADVRAASAEDLKRLSPAEKYDIYQGRFDFPTVNAERDTLSPDAPKWYGICNGVASSIINFPEPSPFQVQGAAGITVPFGASDLKALMAYQQSSRMDGTHVGTSCPTGSSSDPGCQGMNAGSFHVILTNQVGLMQKPVVADIARSGAVENHVPFSYSGTIYSQSTDIYPGAAPGTEKIIGIKMHVRYTASTSPSWDKQPVGQDGTREEGHDYDYMLELDGVGKVIGGTWKSDDRPADMWHRDSGSFSGYYSAINDLMAASRK